MTARVLHHGSTPEPARCLPQHGERAAKDVGQVYAQHADYVFRCLRGLGVRDANTEDALHDVFLVVHAKLHSFDGGAKLTTWLYAIVIQIARKYRARQAGQSAAPDVETAAEHDLEAELSTRRRLAVAHRALATLSDEKREVFVLSDVEGMSAPEICGVLGIPLNTVYSRLRAARADFERCVAGFEARSHMRARGRQR